MIAGASSLSGGTELVSLFLFIYPGLDEIAKLATAVLAPVVVSS